MSASGKHAELGRSKHTGKVQLINLLNFCSGANKLLGKDNLNSVIIDRWQFPTRGWQRIQAAVGQEGKVINWLRERWQRSESSHGGEVPTGALLGSGLGLSCSAAAGTVWEEEWAVGWKVPGSKLRAVKGEADGKELQKDEINCRWRSVLINPKRRTEWEKNPNLKQWEMSSELPFAPWELDAGFNRSMKMLPKAQ